MRSVSFIAILSMVFFIVPLNSDAAPWGKVSSLLFKSTIKNVGRSAGKEAGKAVGREALRNAGREAGKEAASSTQSVFPLFVVGRGVKTMYDSVVCPTCNGVGRHTCTRCHSSGYVGFSKCTSCSGTGRSLCYSCFGSGRKRK